AEFALQFIFVGIAGAICFILYFAIPFFLFVLASIVIMLGGAALAFLKSGGRSLPTVLKNFLSFSLKPKLYLWKKKGGLPPKIIEEKLKLEEDEEAPVPKIIGKSRLKNLSSEIEIK
ncbi:unnamed protein product, partial [marine sediment metagenome]